MALLLDTPVVGIEELTAHDGGLLETSAVEGIDLGKKVFLARDEIALELASVARNAVPPLAESEPLAGVVVTPALRMWLVFRSIELVYRDAFSRQLNDRYKGKWQEYRELAKWAARLLYESGIGTVAAPIPEASAVAATLVPGGLAGGVYYLRSAWTSALGDEGAAGPETAVHADSGQGILAAPGPRPTVAAGWNLYAGTDPGMLWLQNSTPVAVTEPYAVGALAIGTRSPSEGQAPQQYHHARRALQRG